LCQTFYLAQEMAKSVERGKVLQRILPPKKETICILTNFFVF
jgi:hypothetical protein